MQISLVGAGYWGSKLAAELKTISTVTDTEILDMQDKTKAVLSKTFK